MLPHAHAIELVWLIVTVVGLVIVVLSAVAARGDWKRVRLSKDRRMTFIVRVIYISSVVTVAIHTVVVFAAVWGVFNAPPPPDYSEVLQSLMNVFAWIACSTLLTIQALLSHRWRGMLTSGDF